MASGGMGGMGWMQAGQGLMDYYALQEQGKIARIQSGRQKLYQEFAMWNAERTGAMVVAASQRQALEERRQADLVASRALAVAASSGGGVSDPTVVRILSMTKGEGVYRANVALFEGAERARQMRIEAAGGGNFDASSSIRAGANAAGLGRLGRAGLSLYARYGRGGAESQGDAGLLDAGTGDAYNTGFA